MSEPVDVLAIGETMAMVTPLRHESLMEAHDFHIDAGGAESNVACHLANLGHSTAWFSHLGDDPLGHRVARTIATRGVDTSLVRFDASRPTGVYFKNPGAGVHYYRTGSAASALTPADIRQIDFGTVRIVHLSGITPALSASAAAMLHAAFEAARAAGATVSFDVNYRAKLWSAETAAGVLRDYARRADIVFVGLDEARELWGSATVEQARDEIPAPVHLVVKNDAVGATAFDERGTSFEPAMTVEVVESVGAGDAFAAGYLSALLRGAEASERLRSGHRQAALALQTTTDFLDTRSPA